ncbi:aromatic ring-hydroxylating oxygenase subunit alpha [Lutibaculum baratangense]|uniref:Choline monooxygenase n=1 Tax=Lutibaculum baratangense AMV1 TaxID=631454 RepID=V4TEB5_9HYPH|nr:aromatic ring-hydroxylating dioxygenase subunit alpha [Lutibaculum baratangense]ESR24548.1 Choline monooxygenase [Lutibaculum baratangense AMV1]
MLADQATTAVPNDWDRRGLPAWTYTSEEMFEVEKEELFRSRWQLACHVNDVAEPGRYLCFDIAGERAVIIRGRDMQVRAVHNVCRHRGSRVVAAERGQCKAAIVCPFHAWSYNLDGTLRGAARPETLPDLDPVEWGLKPVEMEIWRGFVFIRFKPSEQPSIREIMARFDEEIAPYETETLLPAGDAFWSEALEVNWKAVRDVDNEGYHVPMAHPALQQLYGQHYYDEPFVGGTSRSFATFNESHGKLWSVRHYRSVLPEATWLPESHRKAWLYAGIFPNAVIGLYPDSVMFYQEIPVAVNRTILRGAVYRRPEESRKLKLARYLSGRIDAITSEEDQQLTIWSCEASNSSAFDGIMLSDLEYGVRTYHDELRAVMPVMNEAQAPAEGTLARRNAELLASRGS